MLTEVLQEAMAVQVERLLSAKLEQAGVKARPSAVRRVARQLVSGGSGDVSFGNKAADAADIEITDQDLDAMTAKVEAFAKDDWPKILIQEGDKAADGLYADLHRKWAKEHRQQKKDLAHFRENLEARYGIGLDKLRMLLTGAREWGSEHYQRKYAETGGALAALDDVLIKLHVRGCQVVLEIIVLLEAGLADGAMARWRTLHEITATAMVIAKHGEDLAQRYRDFQIVESKKALSAYEECHEDLGYEPYTEEEKQEVRRRFDDMIAKYGEPFGEEYGWAAHLYGKGRFSRVNFADIEKAADQKMMRAHYRMASYNVHASPKGVYFKLGQIEQSATLLAGHSNAGLVEPAQNAAISLGKLTLTVCSSKDAPPFDNYVFTKVIDRLSREIPHDFAEADSQLKRDHFKTKT